MTDMAATIANVRRILQDRPLEDFITVAIDADDESVTVDNISRFQKGQVWEFSDGADGAELVLIRDVDETTDTITIKRAHENSTAASHDSLTVVFLDPRFRYDYLAQATNNVLATDLYHNGVFELVEHQILSNADATRDYPAPSADCQEFLTIAQMPATFTEPYIFSPRFEFRRLPINIDSSLYANGRLFRILRNVGTAGVDLFYVTCAHYLSLDTLNSAQEKIVEFMACAYALEWTEPRRLQGPTNQGDRTVRPGQAAAQAAYYRDLAKRAIQNENAQIRQNLPSIRTFVPR